MSNTSCISCKFCAYCHSCHSCTSCTSCNSCYDCNYCISSDYCESCKSCISCYDCDSCNSCTNLVNGFMCYNLKLEEKDSSKYWIHNKEVTKEEWDKRYEDIERQNLEVEAIHLERINNHKIIIDNKEIELSEESYKKLKESLS